MHHFITHHSTIYVCLTVLLGVVAHLISPLETLLDITTILMALIYCIVTLPRAIHQGRKFTRWVIKGFK